MTKKHKIHGFLLDAVHRGTPHPGQHASIIVMEIAAELGLVENHVPTSAAHLRALLDSEQTCRTDFEAALSQAASDPPTAIGMAATTLEGVCKAILDKLGKPYPKDETLRSLLKTTLPLLKLSPDQHADPDIKAVLAGLLNTGGGLVDLRNRYSSFHGKGGGQKRLGARHARLAVNAMAALALFLVETYKYREEGRDNDSGTV